MKTLKFKEYKSLNENLNQGFLEPTRENIEEFGLDYSSVDHNSDGSIDYAGDVNIAWMKLTNIPFNFRYVSGMFNCSDNNLETLKGSPKTNEMDFRCSKNKLKSLEFGPETILKYIDIGNERYSITCGSNSIASLKMGPTLVPEYFNCEDNNIIILSDYGRNYKF